MFDRKTVVVTVAAMGLSFGTFCTSLRAQDRQTEDKNPAAAADKNKTADTDANTPAEADMQQKEQMQEKMKSDLKANFNDADFVKVASMANEDEIKAAQSALAKTTNDDVKTFAQHMIDDHTQAGTELKSLADSKGWTVSDTCDIKHMLAIKDLEKLIGPDFDKAYASSAVADHEDAVALFKVAADKASDSDLKAFASKMVPAFEHHLKMAQDLEGKTSAITMIK